MTRARARWAAIVAGVLLVVVLRVLPSVSPGIQLGLVLMAGILTLVLVAVAFLVLGAWIGRPLALLVLLLALAAPIGLTAIDASGGLGVRLPCPRNWAWVPSYLPRASPMRSVRFTIGEVDAKLCYGAPSARGRTMIGGPAIPFGELWRTGANEPTTLRFTGPISVAGVPAHGGKLSIYSVPGPDSWEIIANGSTSQWGIESEYTDAVRSLELGRATVPALSTGGHVEQLRFGIEPRGGDTVGLVLEWERTRIVVPLWPLR
ncbi:MAG: DUF2911 domain-containing protein [Gemmatimonadales bacterium]